MARFADVSRFPIVALTLLLAAETLAEPSGQWSVPAGATVRVTPSQASLQLDKLDIGDGATIIVDPQVGQWHVVAGRVRIGKGVTVLAKGVPGVSGPEGRSAPSASACADGGSGGAGGAGSAGSPGGRLVFDWAVETVGDTIAIDVGGGDGGAGGAGGAGADGGRLSGCDDTNGGGGGDGGAGGDGGEGGRLHLTLRSLGAEPVPLLRDRFRVRAEGGQAGAAGAAGKGGAGSEGHYVTRKTLAGDRKWIPAGETGDAGAPGRAGQAGRAGLVEIVDAAAARLPAVSHGVATSLQPAVKPVNSGSSVVDDVQADLKALRAEVERLSSRVQALEKRLQAQ